jgi:hypothetical protein
MPLEWIISIIGLVIILYFVCKPKPAKSIKDKLTKEIKVKGLPPQYTVDGGGSVL